MMTIEEFLELCNGAPYSQEEVAEICTEVSDNDKLSQSAEDLLSAIAIFDHQLDKIDFEYG